MPTTDRAAAGHNKRGPPDGAFQGRVVAVLTGLAMAAFFSPPARASNDPSFEKQWGINAVGAPAAWAKTTGKGVRIGIVDTGIDLTHEDLAAHIVESTSCIDTKGNSEACKGSAQDDFGHGTHVAGIAAAIKDNGVGVAGIAPDAELVVAKVFQGATANSDDVVAGIKWVVDHGAKVVNLSLGGALFVVSATFGSELGVGVEYAWSRGAIPVIASGNDDLFGVGIGSAEYGDLNALIVGATGHDDQVAAYSSPTGNAKWALVAPGGTGGQVDADNILSTYVGQGEAEPVRLPGRHLDGRPPRHRSRRPAPGPGADQGAGRGADPVHAPIPSPADPTANTAGAGSTSPGPPAPSS